MKWVNDLHAQRIGGRGWGIPRCFGSPGSRDTCPSPGAASELRSTPTPGPGICAPLHLPPPSRAGAAPQDRAGAGAVAGGGEERTHRSRRRSRSSPARPPRCPLGSSPHPWRRSAAPPPAPPPFPSKPEAWKPKSRGHSKEEGRLSRTDETETQSIQRSEIMTFFSPEYRGSGPQPLFSQTEKPGTPVTSSPRAQGAELPPTSMLRSRNPPLPTHSSSGTRSLSPPSTLQAGPGTSSTASGELLGLAVGGEAEPQSQQSESQPRVGVPAGTWV